MSDIPNTAPAGAGDESPAIGPMDIDTAVSMWAELENEPEKEAEAKFEQVDRSSKEAPSEEAPSEEAPAEESGDADDEEAAVETDEDAAPEEDSEPDQEADEQDQLAHGNMRTRLRDGTITTVGELKKLADEGREIRAKIPDLAAVAQRVKDKEAQIAQREEFVQRTLPAILQWQQTRLPPEPDPAMLDESSPSYDPIKYVQDEHKRKLAVAEIQNLYRNMQTHTAQQNQQLEAAREAEERRILEENRRLLVEKIPELTDREKRKEIHQGFVSTAEKYGFSQDDVNNVSDARVFHMIHDLSKKAAAYDKLMSQKSAAEKKTQAAAPVQKPGRRVSPAETAKRSTDGQIKRWREQDRSFTTAVDLLAQFE